MKFIVFSGRVSVVSQMRAEKTIVETNRSQGLLKCANLNQDKLRISALMPEAASIPHVACTQMKSLTCIELEG